MSLEHLLGSKDETLTFLPKTGKTKITKVARKQFTEAEKRQIIDEEGEASNKDRLDLEGTHYLTQTPAEILMQMPFGL